MKFLLQLVFLLITEIAIAQIKFPANPNVRVERDSTFYELHNERFYSYFYQQFDSIFISFDPVKFYQVAVINNKTHNGHFSIQYKSQTLIYYEIRNDNIEGLAYMFNPDLLGKVHKLPYCQATFTENRLDGVVSFYDDETGVIKEIILFKNGNYKKYIYHHLAQSISDLEQGSKLAKDPFKYRAYER